MVWFGMLMLIILLLWIKLIVLFEVVFGEVWLIDKFDVLLEKCLFVKSVYFLFKFIDFK